MGIKLTDEEIVKALDICNSTPCCTSECPYFNKNGRNFCMEGKAFYKDLKDLIHRLQSENERLKKFELYRIEKMKEQKAEIERLTEENFVLYRDRFTKKELDDISACRVKTATAELQKQVDELTQSLLVAKLQGLTEGYIDGVQAERNAQIIKPTVVELPKEITAKIREQAVKNTAKEILQSVDNESNGQTVSVTNVLRKRYGVEVE